MSSTTELSAFQITPSTAAVELPAPYPPHTTFPLSLSPSKPDTPLPDLLSEIQRLSSSGAIHTLLAAHGGAIHFRNLPLRSADAFSLFAHAFGWTPHETIGNPVRRTSLAPNVATANEGPPTLPIYPHNEFGLSPHHPAYVLFYCSAAPSTGGETPINNALVLHEQLRARHPEFFEELDKRGGVQYQLFYPDDDDAAASPGSSVRQAWGARVRDTDDVATARGKVEAEIARLPTATWAWENRGDGAEGEKALGDLRVWQRLPAVRPHPRTGQLSFFNNAVSRFLNAERAGTLLPPHLVREEEGGDGDDHPPIYGRGRYQPPAFYGDGGLIPREYFDSAVRFIEETRALVKWAEGDVLLLDVSV
ncbi:hypothetical protein SLS55_010450 [Diplodia seriata]|uniref:TauD/TfdA-like domain-containing protein n=1 Tax=Diplodia seriata TaxID=420778 RepID=A0ABR3BZA4_9PEZI